MKLFRAFVLYMLIPAGVACAEESSALSIDVPALWNSTTNMETCCHLFSTNRVVTPISISVTFVKSRVGMVSYHFSTNTLTFLEVESYFRERLGPPKSGNTLYRPRTAGWNTIDPSILIAEESNGAVVVITLENRFITNPSSGFGGAAVEDDSPRSTAEQSPAGDTQERAPEE